MKIKIFWKHFFQAYWKWIVVWFILLVYNVAGIIYMIKVTF